MSVGALLLTAGAAVVGAGIATLLHLPAAPLLGAMVGVAVVNIATTSAFAIAPAGRWVVYVCMGWLLGMSVNRETLDQLRSSLVPIVVTVVAFLIFGLVGGLAAVAVHLDRFADRATGHRAGRHRSDGRVLGQRRCQRSDRADRARLANHLGDRADVGRPQADGRTRVTAHRPLDDVRVVDLSRALAGPYATMMMADAGADVVKVEPPGGDDSRGWLPFVARHGHRESAYYMSANRNKRSVVLDLKSDDGADRLRWLVSRADVLVENYRPGVLERLGLGLDDLRALNPRLITLSITGFGRGGPSGKRPGFDQIVQAEAGLMALTGQPGGDPQRIGLPMADILAGLFGAFGVMTALRAREHTGRGQHVETSLLAAVVGVHVFHGVGWLAAGIEPVLTGNRHPSIAPYGVFSCADADIVIGVGSESLWRRFAPIVGLDPERPGHRHQRRPGSPGRCPAEGDRRSAGRPRVRRRPCRPGWGGCAGGQDPHHSGGLRLGAGPRHHGVECAPSDVGGSRHAWLAATAVRQPGTAR